MRRFAGTARRFARAWYPEMLGIGLLTAIAFAGQKDDWLFSVFVLGVALIDRAMCWRHKQMPLHRKMERVHREVKCVQDTADDIRRMLVQDEPDVRNTTHLRVIR